MGTKQEDDSKEPRLELSLPQIIGAALAAGSSAVIASLLGVGGTIVGTIIGSVVATVGTATYTHSLRRSARAVRAIRATHAGTSPATGATDGDAPGGPDQPDDVDAALELDSDQGADTADGDRIAWGKVALAALGVIAVTLGGITVVETMIGKPLAAVVGGSDNDGTTLGNVGSGGRHRTRPAKPQPTTPTPSPTTPAPTETPSPTETPTPTETPSPTPTDTPAPTDPPGTDPGTGTTTDPAAPTNQPTPSQPTPTGTTDG